jgi:hypothetical protein
LDAEGLRNKLGIENRETILFLLLGFFFSFISCNALVLFFSFSFLITTSILTICLSISFNYYSTKQFMANDIYSNDIIIKL